MGKQTLDPHSIPHPPMGRGTSNSSPNSQMPNHSEVQGSSPPKSRKGTNYKHPGASCKFPRGTINILQMNVTGMSGDGDKAREKIDWLMSQETYQVICIQEQKLTGHRYLSIMGKLKRKYHVNGHPALPLRCKSRGGVMILTLKHIYSAPFWDIHNSTKLWNATMIHCTGARGVAGNLLIGNCYLPPDDEATNLKTMHEISRVMHAVKCPFLWVGDFNRPPEEINPQHFKLGSNMHIITPHNTPTTYTSAGHSTLIDYGLASTPMHHLIKICTGHPVIANISGHIGVDYEVVGDMRHICTNRQIIPPKASISTDYARQWEWSRCEEFVSEHCSHIPRAPLPEQVTYADSIGRLIESNMNGLFYSKWSMTSEV